LHGGSIDRAPVGANERTCRQTGAERKETLSQAANFLTLHTERT
jgi:hypothetical protein